MLEEERFDAAPKAKLPRLNILPANPESADEGAAVGLGRFPSWLHRKIPKGGQIAKTGDVLAKNRLHTVCEEAKCPNLLECWSKKTATFLIMGKECTRSCGFCDIDFSKKPKPLDAEEPQRVADSVAQLGLKHVVITMVARDDLVDGGASHLSRVVEAVRVHNREVTVEVLTSDFEGNIAAWERVLEAQPEIMNYNIETVRALTPRVRHTATYERTLAFLHYMSTHKRSSRLKVKSGMMVGLGETEEEVQETIRDLHQSGCEIITIGQYLQANHRKLLVKAFITPEQFKKYEEYGYHIGVKYMYCGPFVRSSYNAGSIVEEGLQNASPFPSSDG
jgi:lipoic acid synthetase